MSAARKPCSNFRSSMSIFGRRDHLTPWLRVLKSHRTKDVLEMAIYGRLLRAIFYASFLYPPKRYCLRYIVAVRFNRLVLKLTVLLSAGLCGIRVQIYSVPP